MLCKYGLLHALLPTFAPRFFSWQAKGALKPTPPRLPTISVPNMHRQPKLPVGQRCPLFLRPTAWPRSTAQRATAQCGTHPMAYLRVHSRAVSSYRARSVL